MNALPRGFRYAALFALVLALPVAAACSADATGTGEDDVTGEDDLEIEFPKMYSAFTGPDHEFKVPARVASSKNTQWSADPKDMVSLDRQSDGSVMITTLKAGKVKIIAKVGSLRGTAELDITAADPEDLDNGKQRYANGIVPQKRERPDGGWGGSRDGGGGRGLDKKTACTTCHNKGGADGANIEHTPMQTAGFSNDELVKIFTEGKKPDGVDLRATTKEKFKKFHTWEMEEDEKKGLITYLRSLEPKSQGDVDFDFPGRGKGKGSGGGGGGGGKRDGGGENRPEDAGGAVN